VQVTWSWTVPFTLAQGSGGSIDVTGRVDPHATPGSFTNEATLTADNLSQAEVRKVDMVVASTTLLTGRKLVRGSRDVAFVGAGTEGHTAAGGSATYVAQVQNVSAVPVNHLVLIDILPAPGDTGVRSTTPRGSTWRPLLSDGGSSPQAPVAVSYSASSNPCRPEVGFSGSCDAAGWSSSPPGGQLAEARALKADFGGFVLAPGATATFTWTMATPGDVSPGAMAWNSFAFAAQRADNGEQLVASEPAEVGLIVDGEGQLSLKIVKRVNGMAAPEPPGPFIPVGDPLVFTYEVSNTGTVPAYDVAVVDDVLGPIPCPKPTLAPGESMICTAPTQLAIAGQQTNLAILIAAVAQDGPTVMLGTSRLYNFGAEKTTARIGLVKQINNQVARQTPGLNVPAGAPVTFTYTVSNGGALTVADLTVIDDRLAGVSCPKASLKPEEHMICTAPAQIAVEGTHVNTATATGQPLNPRGNPTGSPVTATDRAYYTNTIAVAGSNTGPLAALGGALLAAGLGLTGLSRIRPRRRRAVHSG
jgi:hypothetical protein